MKGKLKMAENENVVNTETNNTEVDTTNTDNSIAEEKTTNNGVEDSSNDVDFKDEDEEKIENGSDSKSNSSSQKQSRAENRKQAQIRRERELAEKQKYLDGFKAGTGGINKFTGQEIETEEDMQWYQDQLDAEKKGLDPESSSDMRKYQLEKIQKQKEAEEAQKKADEEKTAKEKEEAERVKTLAREKAEKDLNDFKAKYKDVDFEGLMETDSKFNKFANTAIRGGMNLIETYELYHEIKNGDTVDRANQLAEQMVKNAAASSGSQTYGEESPQTYDFGKMSDEEFRKAVQAKKEGKLKF